MGFFSKVWKGVKKGFKKIGKGIKKGFKAFGKFMGKIGILGTIALTMLTGGLGIGSMFGNFGATLGKLGASMGGPLGGILKGASWTIGKAAQFGNAVKSGFQTLTKGVTEFFKQTGKYVGNKLGMNIQGAPTSFLGEGGVWQNTSEAVVDQFKTFKGNVENLFTTTSPTLEAGKLGMSYDDFKNTNSFNRDLSDLKDGFDPNNLVQEGDVKTLVFDEMGVPKSDIIGTGGLKDIAAEVVSTENTSLLSRGYTSAKDNLFKGVTEAPGAVVTTAIVNKAMGAGDQEPYFGNTRVADFDSSYAISGAVAQGLTQGPDPLWSQQLFDYDAYGGGQGGYSNVYANRMRGAMT